MYRPPIDDYDFLYTHVFGDELLHTLGYSELDAADVHDILTTAADFAVQVMHPLNAVGDRVGSVLAEGVVTTPPGYVKAYRSFTEAGWVGFGLDSEIGGGGVPLVVYNAVSELWTAANTAFSLCWGLSTAAITALQTAGSEELRATYLPKMVSGEWTGTMNLTEPQSGTDLAAIRTTARPNGDGTWSVCGQKIFITWGDHDLTENIVHLVLARTPDAPEGLAGLSLFVVPKFLPSRDGGVGERNRVTTLALEHKLGIHASPTCVLEYDDAVGHLVGQRHFGLMAMFVMMNNTRIGVGLQGLGVADRAYQQARDYAEQRVQGRVLGRPSGAPIAEHPDVARLLLSMSSSISAMRAFSLQLGEWCDRWRRDDSQQAAQLAEFFVPVMKAWFTEESVRIASDAIQVHGGMGFIEETGAAQYYRDARILPIYEGTTGIQSNDLLGRKVIRDKGATTALALELITSDSASLRQSQHPVARRTVERLDRAIVCARDTTRRLLELAANDRRDAYAGSVNYLTMMALIAGAWMHARIISAALLAHPEPTEDDLRRLREADFYGAHHLSRVHSLAEAIREGEIE
ncbi:acyl-CoA dehydrogenase [Nocardia xishanensis]|uniref:Acyl-CoA dehydrogenase n=1 Tax=Nocardia xishanensis TaxID=238964 RepID=A0ABW7WRI2_9NOCA